MKIRIKTVKLQVCIAAAMLTIFSLSACTPPGNPENEPPLHSTALPPEPENKASVDVLENQGTSDASEVQKTEDAVSASDAVDSQVELRNENSAGASTEEECIKVLEKYSGPFGTEYDALALVGTFRYPGKSENETLQMLKNASELWHKAVVEKIGEEWNVSILPLEKTTVGAEESVIAEWNSVNGKTAEAYTNVKCSVSTDCSNGKTELDIGLVKVDGVWHLANVGTLNSLQSIIAGA